MKVLIEKLKEHDPYTYLHSQRVAQLSVEIAKVLEFSEQDLKKIYYGALLHDIGKIEIDKNILNKPDKLTRDEWRLIQQHPIFGYKIIFQYCSGDILPYIALMHHERSDGSGYPFGITKDRIPPEVQIVAVADSFDAMTTQRMYNRAKTAQEALDELVIDSTVLFLPETVDALKECLKNIFNK